MSEEEFEERQLTKLISDLRDINSYTDFKNGAFIYDLGHYQGLLLVNEIERLNNIINELEKALKDNIDMCDGFIDTATSDLQELGARHNGKVYYQNLLLENKIALKIYQNELNKLQELKGSDKE